MTGEEIMRTQAPVVKVGATAEASIEPDIAIFGIRFGRRCKAQDACATDFASEQQKVKVALERFGVVDDFKTSGYASYAHRTGKRGTIDGYDYVCYGSLEVTRKNNDVGAIWQALAECGTSASIRLHYELKDVHASEDALIRQAVERARSSAETLAEAAGMVLGGVKEIRYRRDNDGFGTICFDAAPPSSPLGDSSMPDFSPEPINIECHVDVDWWLANTASH